MCSCLDSNVIAKAAFQMCAGSEESDIVLLGEHTLVLLNSQGQLCLQKRFDYQPVAFTMYNVSAMAAVHTVCSTDCDRFQAPVMYI